MAEEAQLTHLLGAMRAMRDGTFTRRLAPTGTGMLAELATLYDEIADRQLHLATELDRVRRLSGREGRHGERLTTGVGRGSWATSIEAANSLVTDLVRPAEDFARVVSAVSAGDLTQRMAVRVDGRPLRGDPLRVAKDVNGLVD
jgi:methyl-accepting chemotaxis protein